MEEIWKPVEGYEGLYEVSTHGRVRSIDRIVPTKRSRSGFSTRKGKILSPYVGTNGYYRVLLSKNGCINKLSIHRLVAIAFVHGQTEEKNIINHKDRNPANNHADNLEWCTPSYNATYAGARYRAWDTIKANNLKYPSPPKPVEAIKDGKVVRRFISITEAAQAVGMDSSTVGNCCKGRTKTCAGFGWRYATDDEPVPALTQEEWETLKRTVYTRLKPGAHLEGFMGVYEQWKAGKLSINRAAQMLKVSRNVINNRIKRLESLATEKQS